MPWRVSVTLAAALLLPAVGLPAQSVDTPPPEQAAGYDSVGFATIGAEAGVGHPSLPVGAFVEVTALDSGRTILVMVTRQGGDGAEIVLPATSAQALGMTSGPRRAVRVRAASPAAADRGALESGRGFVARADAPEVLLVPLRRKLDRVPVAVTPSHRPDAAPKPLPAKPQLANSEPEKPQPPKFAPAKLAPAKPAPAKPAPVIARPAAGGAYSVQVAALSDPGRAQTLARAIGGRVVSAGRLHRVRLGPFADQRSAQAARDAVARRGYGDARIVRD